MLLYFVCLLLGAGQVVYSRFIRVFRLTTQLLGWQYLPTGWSVSLSLDCFTTVGLRGWILLSLMILWRFPSAPPLSYLNSYFLELVDESGSKETLRKRFARSRPLNPSTLPSSSWRIHVASWHENGFSILSDIRQRKDKMEHSLTYKCIYPHPLCTVKIASFVCLFWQTVALPEHSPLRSWYTVNLTSSSPTCPSLLVTHTHTAVNTSIEAVIHSAVFWQFTFSLLFLLCPHDQHDIYNTSSVSSAFLHDYSCLCYYKRFDTLSLLTVSSCSDK